MAKETIKVQVPEWMDEAIASRAEQELTTKNAIVLKVLSDAIAQSGEQSLPLPRSAASQPPKEHLDNHHPS